VKKSSLLNKNLFSMNLLTARSLPVVIQQFEQLLSDKIAGSYTTEIKNRQGRILEVEISSFFLVKKDNEVDNFVLIVRDITARNEAEQQRLEEHALLQALLEHMPDMVTFKDDQHRFIKVSRLYAATAHMTPEQMIGKTDFDFFPSEIAQRIIDDENAIMRSGQAIVDRLEKMVAEDNSERWISVTQLPRYNDEGTIIGTLGIFRDVTSWKELEAENGQAFSLVQILLDSTNDPVSVKDIQHRFVHVNKALAMSLRVSPESMIGKTDFEYMSKEQAQKAFEQEAMILQTGSSVLDSVEMITDSTGNQRCISVTKIPWFNREGTIVGTVCYSRDVTHYKKV
jgi:two-component system sensor histidine kinase/response regulator